MFSFIKYSATGNDFVLVDNFKKKYKLNSALARRLCHRNLGIGADGVIFLQKKSGFDFEMVIFNPDGSEAEMCGNGARAALHFFHHHVAKKRKKNYQFKTMNGVYHGEVAKDQVSLEMSELSQIQIPKGKDFANYKNLLFLNTGVPHLVLEVKDLENFPVAERGAYFRRHRQFSKGANVDFFEVLDSKKQSIYLRTFERGVEAETLACGTGVVATAIACRRFFGWEGKIRVKVHGGDLMVDLSNSRRLFSGDVMSLYTGKVAKNWL